jgi:hypothetical protein
MQGMKMGLCMTLLGIALGACQSAPTGPAPLARNTLACRDAAAVAELASGGERFQRIADDAMASGRCRMFQAGHKVSGRRVEKGLIRFVDAGSGRVYWAYGGT